MYKYCILLFIFTIFSCTLFAQHWQWATGSLQEGTPGRSSLAHGTAVDKAGNVYVTGEFEGDIFLNGITLKRPSTPGFQPYMFLLKYDHCGNLLWARQTEGDGSAQGWSLSIDEQNNLYVAGGISGTVSFGSLSVNGSFNNSGFIAKYNSNGDVLWVKLTLGSICWSVSNDKAGYIYFTGTTGGSISDIFIAKYHTLGQEIWTKLIHTSEHGVGLDIKADQNGDIYITGNFVKEIDFGIGKLSCNNTENEYCGFAAKYNAQGEPQWFMNLYDSLQSNEGTGIALSATGNLYITGMAQTGSSSNGTFITGYFLAKYDTSGKTQWKKKGEYAYMRKIMLDTTENIYLVGDGSGLSDIPFNTTGMFVARLDSSGKGKWLKGASPYIFSASVSFIHEQEIYVGGSYVGQNFFDTLTLNGTDNTANFYLAKVYNPIRLPEQDTTICSGIPAQIGSVPKPNHTYQWSPAASLSNPSVANPFFQYVNDTDSIVKKTYTLQITDKTCEKYPVTYIDSVTITVLLAYASIQIITGSTTVCPFTGGIKYWVKPGTGYTYEWSIAGGEIVEGQETDTITVDWQAPNSQAFVKVTARNVYGCSSSFILPIFVEQLLKPNRPEGNEAICLDSAANQIYQTSLLNNDSSYEWYTDDAEAMMGVRNQPTLTISWTRPGRKKLWVVETSKTPCKGSSDTLLIDIFPPPDSTLLIEGPLRIGEFAQGVKYLLNGFTGSTYTWALPEGGGSFVNDVTENQIQINWMQWGEYPLTVQEISQEGCVGKIIDTRITVEKLFIPNVITPNGDKDNQSLIIPQIAYYPDNHIEIYNRWGKVVYSQKNYSNTWEAADLSSGVYYYILYTHAGKYKGYVHVLR